jgi:hypothetical protein
VFAAVVLAGTAPVAQGVVYPIRYDPEFDGITLVDLPQACLDLNLTGTLSVSGHPACALNLVPGVDVQDVTADPFPNLTTHWKDVAGITNYLDIATDVFIDAGGAFTQFATRLGEIILIADGVCEDRFSGCDAALLGFSIGGSENPAFPGVAKLTVGTYQCFKDDGVFCDFYSGTEPRVLSSFYRAPEPGTLALLSLGLAGIAAARRRRRK